MIEFLLGDLREEYILLCEERGQTRARLWYVRQLVLSLPMIVKPDAILRPASIAGTLLLLDRLWGQVYSAIPLKDGLNRAPGYLAANIVCACLCAAVARPAPLTAALATVFALTFAVASEPVVYICLALTAIPLASYLRRLYEMA
jgi:hypothetical protein